MQGGKGAWWREGNKWQHCKGTGGTAESEAGRGVHRNWPGEKSHLKRCVGVLKGRKSVSHLKTDDCPPVISNVAVGVDLKGN